MCFIGECGQFDTMVAVRFIHQGSPSASGPSPNLQISNGLPVMWERLPRVIHNTHVNETVRPGSGERREEG